MTVRGMLALAGCLTALLAASACGGTPTEPSAYTPRPSSFAPLQVQCTVDPELRCSAQRFGEGDLTAQAEWFATDLPWGTTPQPGVTFAQPGVPVATRPAKLYIAARVGTETRASSFSYDMAPGAKAIPLALLFGYVFQGETSLAGLADVRIDILEGDGVAGLSAMTNMNGSYQLFHVRVGVPFTMRAFRPGWSPSVVRHDGIKALPEGFPDFSTTVQHFRVMPLP